jgi:GDSL-like Lipase/Acylhydrolase family
MSSPCGWRVCRALGLSVLAAVLAGACGHDPQVQAEQLRRSLSVEIDRYVEADRSAPPAHCQVLFVGSSSIVLWKPTLAADMAPLPVINRGFGSSHIEHVNLWFDEIVAPYHPRSIVFYAGENDLNAGKPVTRVLADFDAFMAKKTAALGATPVYFISVKPSKQRLAELPQQTELNDAIRTRAAQRSDLHYIDVVPLMLDHGVPRDIYLPDGLHMSRDGYVLWSAAVKAALLPDDSAELRRCERREPGRQVSPGF